MGLYLVLMMDSMMAESWVYYLDQYWDQKRDLHLALMKVHYLVYLMA